MCTSARIDQTFELAIRQRDSVSSAPDRRMVFSRRRERSVSVSVGREEDSMEGESIGLSSVVMVKRPSIGRSGKGVTTWADMCVWILEGGVSEGWMRKETELIGN